MKLTTPWLCGHSTGSRGSSSHDTQLDIMSLEAVPSIRELESERERERDPSHGFTLFTGWRILSKDIGVKSFWMV